MWCEREVPFFTIFYLPELESPRCCRILRSAVNFGKTSGDHTYPPFEIVLYLRKNANTHHYVYLCHFMHIISKGMLICILVLHSLSLSTHILLALKQENIFACLAFKLLFLRSHHNPKYLSLLLLDFRASIL